MPTTRSKSGKSTTRVTRTPIRTRGGGYGGGLGTDQSYHAVHAGPWIVMGLCLVMGVVFNIFASTAVSMAGMVALTVVATAGLTYSAWMTSRRRSGVARWHSVITVLYGGGWLALCTVTGVLTREQVGTQRDYHGEIVPTYAYHLVGPTVALWLVGGVALALAWNARIGTRIGEVKEAAIAANMADPEPTPWEEAGFEGVKTREKRINPYRSEGVATLRGKGNTLEALQHGARQLEVCNGWPHESLTFIPHPTANNARNVKYVVMHADPLKEPVIWPGLQLPRKATIWTPVPRGIDATGEVRCITEATRDGGQHRMVVGMTGSGKTVGEAPSLITAAAVGADIILIDTVKRTMSYGELASVFQLFVIDPGMARAVLERLMSHTLPARTQQLAREGRKAWAPGSALNFLVLHIEEAWQLADVSEIVDIALAFRSAGGRLGYSIQRSTFDQMPVTLRNQLGTVLHFGIVDKDDEQYALPDEVRHAGAHPSKWRDEQPGMHYAIQRGLTLEQKTTAVRAWRDPGDLDPASPLSFAHVAEKVGSTLHKMDQITADSLGDLWINRVRPVDLVRQVGGQAIPGPATQEALAPQPTQKGFDMSTTTMTALPSDVIDGKAAEAFIPAYGPNGSLVFGREDGLPSEVIDLGGDIDPATLSDPYGKLPEPPEGTRSMRIGEPSDPDAAPREDYETAMEERLAELLADPSHAVIRAVDFMPVYTECRWSRPSAYDFLKKWASEGRLVKLSSGKGWIPVRDQST